jgi:hypothetical protein
MKPHTQNAEGGPGTRGSGPQQKAEPVVDWRVRFQKSPVTFLAVALGGAVLIGIAITQAKKVLFDPMPHQQPTPGKAQAHPD